MENISVKDDLLVVNVVEPGDNVPIQITSDNVSVIDYQPESILVTETVEGSINVTDNDILVSVTDINEIIKPTFSEVLQPVQFFNDLRFTNSKPTPYTVGGINSGSVFDQVPVLDMWTKLLYPFIQPTFSSFNMASQYNVLEVGAGVTGGLRTFNWATTNAENIKPNTISISKNNTVLYSGGANDTIENLNIGTDIINTGLASVVFKITCLDVLNNTISRTQTISWRYKIYYGSNLNTTLTETEIKALSGNTLKNSRNGTYQVTTAGYKFIAWPVIFGTFSTFKDPDTNQDIAVNLPEIVSITNGFGVTADYYLYRSTYILNSALTMVIT